MYRYRQGILGIVFVGLTACAVAGDGNSQAVTTPPGGDYKKVSDLVPLPEFIPGLGTLYVQPDTLPAGPFLAYDRGGRLVSTVYMIPLADLQNQKNFEDLDVGGQKIVSTDIIYNAGHPGVAEPHYHIVLHHVPAADAKLK